jgi:hypothetical protein
VPLTRVDGALGALRTLATSLTCAHMCALIALRAHTRVLNTNNYSLLLLLLLPLAPHKNCRCLLDKCKVIHVSPVSWRGGDLRCVGVEGAAVSAMGNGTFSSYMCTCTVVLAWGCLDHRCSCT